MSYDLLEVQYLSAERKIQAFENSLISTLQRKILCLKSLKRIILIFAFLLFTELNTNAKMHQPKLNNDTKLSSTKLILDEGFEQKSSLYEQNWWGGSGNDRGLITDFVSREGKRAARFEVVSADDGDFRSEITTAEKNPAAKNYTIGKEYWYGVSIMPDKNLTKSPFAEVVYQFHSTPDGVPGETWSNGLNPPVALYCDSETWSIQVKGDDKPVTDKSNYLFTTSANLGEVAKGQWTDWVFHIKWNYDGNGFVQIWKNGKMVFNLHGPNTYNDQVGPYLKMGVYAWYLKRPGTDPWKKAKEANVGNRVYYHDAVRIADENGSAQLVSPSGVICEPVQEKLKTVWTEISKQNK